MLESDFWGKLEYRVCRELESMFDQKRRGWWCDGFLADQLDEVRGQITGRVWIGRGRSQQEEWDFVLLLRNQLLVHEQVDWNTLLPDERARGWLSIDVQRKLLTINLPAIDAHGNQEHHDKPRIGRKTMYDRIEIVGGPLVLSNRTDVEVLENHLGIRMPIGYSEYVTQFGEGILGHFVRIYPPHRILSDLQAWRRRIDEFWFWHQACGFLTKDQALRSIIVADTLDGDELIVHPSNNERIYVLPRQSKDVYAAGEGLPATIDWIFSSGILIDPCIKLNFEPFRA